MKEGRTVNQIAFPTFNPCAHQVPVIPRHLLEDPLGGLALDRESEVLSELAALGDELLLDVNLDIVQFLLQLL